MSFFVSSGENPVILLFSSFGVNSSFASSTLLFRSSLILGDLSGETAIGKKFFVKLINCFRTN